MCSPAYSAALRTSRISGPLVAVDPARQLVGVDQLDPVHRPLLRAPGGHPALEEAAHRQPDRGQQLGGVALVAVGGGDDDDVGARRGDPRDLGREAGVVGGGAERAGDVGLVELLVGAAVDHHRALPRPAPRPRAGLSGAGVPKSSTSGPRLRPTMCSTFGGLSPSEPTCVLDELGLVGDRQGAVVAALEADRRGGLEVEPGAAAERAAEVAGPDLDLVGQRQQPLVQRAEHVGGALARLDRQVGAGDVADEQRVAAQQRPGVAAAAGVAEQEGGVLGPVAGRVDRLDRRGRPAPASSRRRTARAGTRPRPARGRGSSRRCCGQAAVAGDVVGVVVGLEHVPDPHPVQARQAPVGVDVPLRVDDRGDARLRGRRPGRRRSRGPRG